MGKTQREHSQRRGDQRAQAQARARGGRGRGRGRGRNADYAPCTELALEQVGLSKVCDLEGAVGSNQDVAWAKVAVRDFHLVAVREPVADLERVRTDVALAQLDYGEDEGHILEENM